MDDVLVRLLNNDDISFVHELNVMEGWGDTRRDIERMLEYEPNGCFLAEVNGERVGHIFTVNYGLLGWIGLLIVKPAYRRRGIGSLLMKRAIKYLLDRGVKTIRLESVYKIANLYRNLGFIDEYDSLKLQGLSFEHKLSQSNVFPMREEELGEVAKFDEKYSGANRFRVLSKLYHDYPHLCFVSRLNSKILGYIMCRERMDGYRIGPWICSPHRPQIALNLLLKCLSVLEPKVKIFIGVPAVKILQKQVFRQYSKSIRMYLGVKIEDEPEGVYAIGGPEKG